VHHFGETKEQKAVIRTPPDPGCAELYAQATAGLRAAFGHERNHWVLAPPQPACGQDALREKLRECSRPDGCKSGNR
jgi:hypothetical protein